MSEAQQDPVEGVSHALNDLSEQTRLLVRQEVQAAREEVVERLRAAAPGVGLAAVAGVLGMTAAASAYRWFLRLLEKMLPPATAAFVATALPGAVAGMAAVAAKRKLAEAPAPFPTQTAAAAARTAADIGSRAG